MVKRITLVMLCLGLYFAAGAQEPTQSKASDASGMEVEDYFNLRIPPLAELLENAKHSPGVEYYNAQAEEYEMSLKVSRRSWLEHIALSAYYQHGITYLMTSYYDDMSNLPDASTGRMQDIYGVGASMSMPLSEIFSRGANNKVVQARIKQAETSAEQVIEEKSLKIIEAYTQLMSGMALLKSAAEAKSVATGQYSVIESQFINGQIDAEILGRQKLIETQAIREYEQIRYQIQGAILTLEILSNTKIINK